MSQFDNFSADDFERKLREIKRTVDEGDSRLRVPRSAGNEDDPAEPVDRKIIRPDLPPREDDPGGGGSIDVREDSELVRQVKNRMQRAANFIRRGWQQADLVTIYRGIDLINLTYAQVGTEPFNQFYEQAFDQIERAIRNDALGNLEQALDLMNQGYNYVQKDLTLPDPIGDPPSDPVRDPIPRTGREPAQIDREDIGDLRQRLRIR